ncbi:MAG: LacI family transcriptional regulator [Spirochaetia bacterium]|nr:LacI family transcriptional regulator [Spirochaetia bacterium]
MSITIKDVAKHAGVSHTTVSMVIHNDARITAETKEKVTKSIKELKYHPNIMARGLVQGRTNNIAVIATYFSSFFEMNFLKGLEQEMGDSEYQINEYSTRARPGVKEGIMETIIYGKRADALIALSIKPSKELLEEFKSASIPVVLVEENLKGTHSVKADNFRGGFLAGEHLMQKGRKNIGVVVGMLDGDEVGTSPAERLNGFKKAQADFGIKFDKKYVYEIRNFDFNDGREALNEFHRRGCKLDGVFCAAGDYIAMGFMQECGQKGIKIPDDISVVGYDDLEMSAIVNPPLTTIRQSISELGREAYKIAVDAINKKIKEPKQIILQPELVVRKSS